MEDIFSKMGRCLVNKITCRLNEKSYVMYQTKQLNSIIK